MPSTLGNAASMRSGKKFGTFGRLECFTGIGAPRVEGAEFVTHERNGTVLRDLRTLFNVGATADLTDGQLLERFATGVDEEAELAFTVIVERHGPMVVRTCRGILRGDHDVQDAFQATFLILVRQGGKLWVRDSLGPWLHRVACRVAVRARLAVRRRRAAEQRAAELAKWIIADAGWDDLEGVLHEEIDRLPDRYRIPIVLCDLDGRTYEEAARHLGCPVGTVKSRLARDRDRLRDRLSRRGIGSSASAIGTLYPSESAASAVQRFGLDPVARSALRFVTGTSDAAGAVSAKVLLLADGVSRSMMLTKLKWAAATVMAVALAGPGASQFGAWASCGPPIPTGRLAGGDERPGVPPVQPAGPSAPKPRDPAIAQERKMPLFDSIHVSGDLRVVVTRGKDHRVTVLGDPKLLLSLSPPEETKASHRSLIVKASIPDGNRGDIKARGDVEVRIDTPSLLRAIADDGARVEIQDLREKFLALKVSDTAKMTVSGTSHIIRAWLEKSGELDASRLDVEDANISASGRSSSVWNVKNILSVISSGDARVEYLGSPVRLNTMSAERSRLIQRPNPPDPTPEGPSRP
jgi:RNA polymerase sigma factor (sigma-70 family)